MKYVQHILIFLLLLILLHPRLSFSQQAKADTLTTRVFKNSIKGMPILVPMVFVAVYAGASVGYERYISKHHGIEMSCAYYFNTDEMGGTYHNFSIMPAYKFFSVSEKEKLNNFWISLYLNYFLHAQVLSDQGRHWNGLYYYGIGISVGKKINLTHNKKWFMDLGFGVSYNKYFDEPIFSDTEWHEKFLGDSFLPRLAFQIGRKF